MPSLIQRPLSNNLLEIFGTQKTTSDAVRTLTQSVQPVYEVAPAQYLDGYQYDASTGVALAIGYSVVTTNNTGFPIRIYGGNVRGGAVLGAGVTIGGFLACTETDGLFTPYVELSPEKSYTTGQHPNWAIPSDRARLSSLFVNPGATLGFFCTTLVGASPLFTMVVQYSVVRS